MRKGSVTIFSLLSIMLVASAVFALLEASRFQSLSRLTQLQTKVALESVFAEYNTYLWDEYRLLACKQSEVNSDIEQSVESRRLDNVLGTNFFQFQVGEIQQEGYTRLTDGDGRAFIQAATSYMEKNLFYETAKTIYNQYEGIKNIKSNSEFDFSDIETALKKLNEEELSVGTTGKSQKEMNTEDVHENSATVYKIKENPLKTIQDIQKKGILSLVMEDTSQLSQKEVDVSGLVSNRSLPEDYYPSLEEMDWYTRVLFQQYLLTYLSNYIDEKDHTLKYELEYLLGGMASEVENMKAVVHQLLGVREAANFLYLVSNPVKVEQARLLAVAIIGASLNPVLIDVVKTAVLAAWAFAESILDIRTLLTGGKIALLKSDTTWTIELDYISTIGEGYSKAKSCANGLGYLEYLGVLLLFQQETQLAKGAMDVQELTLRERYGTQDIYLDEWITDIRVYVTYQYKPVFFSINKVMPYWKYEISIREEFGYERR